MLKSNIRRITELRFFTLQNAMFLIALSSFFLFLFDLSGGWNMLFLVNTGFELFKLVDWVKFIFTAIFFLLSVAFIVFFLYTAIRWSLGKYKDEPDSSDLDYNKSSILKRVDDFHKMKDDLEEICKKLHDEPEVEDKTKEDK